MRNYDYVKAFEEKAFGLFVHFGIYSVLGKGEWAYSRLSDEERLEYAHLPEKFAVKPGWAEELADAALDAGCRYITLTTRHHDGFSLYDTCGLSDFDAPHSASGRDLVAEFVEACRSRGIMPMFYHTLLDWSRPEYKGDFPAYIDYLVKSIEILCTRYGKIGGLWFDGMWDRDDVDWQEDRIYGTIRKYQPDAMIINNTGLGALGQLGHKELDSVTYERGKPARVNSPDRPVAGEMCEVMNEHWGYAARDICYKPVSTLLWDLVFCRSENCNFLLNAGPMGDGSLRSIDRCILSLIGQWVKSYGDFIYRVRRSGISADNALILKDEEKYYAVAVNSDTFLDEHVTRSGEGGKVVIKDAQRKLKSVRWLDDGSEELHTDDSFPIKPFEYGRSEILRVAELEFEDRI